MKPSPTTLKIEVSQLISRPQKHVMGVSATLLTTGLSETSFGPHWVFSDLLAKVPKLPSKVGICT